MIAEEAQVAVRMLQRNCLASTTDYWITRYERALDECLRNPDRTTPALHQVNNAMANAKKIMDRRGTLAAMTPLDDEIVFSSGAGGFDEFSVVDLKLWLERVPGLTPVERSILRDLAAGEDAESLASRARTSVASMTQKISRARASARRALSRYDAD